jgi:Rad3-related DNA helicase
LFGLRSFWEGVDIAGDVLSLVVIDKLPFNHLGDPVHKARRERIEEEHGKWQGYALYEVPQVIIRLKQGVGRLIRANTDRGVMAILDGRMHTKGYAKTIRAALPNAREASSLQDIEQFFKEA